MLVRQYKRPRRAPIFRGDFDRWCHRWRPDRAARAPHGWTDPQGMVIVLSMLNENYGLYTSIFWAGGLILGGARVYKYRVLYHCAIGNVVRHHGTEGGSTLSQRVPW